MLRLISPVNTRDLRSGDEELNLQDRRVICDPTFHF